MVEERDILKSGLLIVVFGVLMLLGAYGEDIKAMKQAKTEVKQEQSKELSKLEQARLEKLTTEEQKNYEKLMLDLRAFNKAKDEIAKELVNNGYYSKSLASPYAKVNQFEGKLEESINSYVDKTYSKLESYKREDMKKSLKDFYTYWTEQGITINVMLEETTGKTIYNFSFSNTNLR